MNNMVDNTITSEQFAREWTKRYEVGVTPLRGAVTTKGEIDGKTYHFIIQGAADIARERGANGLIPAGHDDQTSVTVTLKEYHSYRKKNGLNIYASSVDQRAGLQDLNVEEMNKRTDSLIIDAMATATQSTQSAVATLEWLLTGFETLWANGVPNDGRNWFMASSRAWAQLMKVEQFTNSRYVDNRPFMKGLEIYDFMGFKCFMYPGKRLPGLKHGTNNALCFAWHESAIGHAYGKQLTQIEADYNKEQDYSWSRVTSYQGAKKLLDEGIVKMIHDDTAAL